MRPCEIRGSKRALLETTEPVRPPRRLVVQEVDTRSEMEIVWIDDERYAVTVRIRSVEKDLKLQVRGSWAVAVVPNHRAPLQK